MSHVDHAHTHLCPSTMRYHFLMWTCTIKECKREKNKLCYICENNAKTARESD